MTCPRCSVPSVRAGWCVNCGELPVTLAAPRAASLSRERATRRAAVPWTEEHWAFCVARAGRMSGREIARELTEAFGIPRTWKAVKHQFERRCVSKPEVRSAVRVPIRKRALVAMGPGSRWSAPEIEALEDGEVRILVRGGRSPHSVAVKASRLGAPLRSGDGMMSVRQVAQRWHIRHASVLEWIRRGVLPAERSGDVWRIDPVLAERLVPGLRRCAKAHAGLRGWWERDHVRALVASAIEASKELDRLVDDLVRPDLVRSEE